ICRHLVIQAFHLNVAALSCHIYPLSLHDALPILEATIEEIELYPDLYRIAEMVIENVSNYIVKKMPEFEVIYLFRYLVSSRLVRSEEHTSELQSRFDLVCRLLLEKKNIELISMYR